MLSRVTIAGRRLKKAGHKSYSVKSGGEKNNNHTRSQKKWGGSVGGFGKKRREAGRVAYHEKESLYGAKKKGKKGKATFL